MVADAIRFVSEYAKSKYQSNNYQEEAELGTANCICYLLWTTPFKWNVLT